MVENYKEESKLSILNYIRIFQATNPHRSIYLQDSAFTRLGTKLENITLRFIDMGS